MTGSSDPTETLADLDAERGVLTAVLIDNTVTARLDLAPEEFADAANGEIWCAMRGLMPGLIDSITLNAALPGRPDLHAVVAGLVPQLPVGTRPIPPAALLDQAAQYAAIVRGMARRRHRRDCALLLQDGAERGDTAQAEAVVQALLAEPGDGVAEPPTRPRLVLPDWLVTTPPPWQWLLMGPEPGQCVLPQGVVGILAAAGGVGKTLALCDLAIAVASGGQWLLTYYATRVGRVLLVAAEEDEKEIRRRLHTIFHAVTDGFTDGQKGGIIKRLLANLHTWGPRGQDVRLLAPDRLTGAGRVGADSHLVPTATARSLRRYLLERGPWDLVILDPLARFGAPDAETSADHATRTIEALEALTKVPGNPTVLVAHHVAKSRAMGAKSDEMAQAAARGHSALVDGARWMVNLVPRPVVDGCDVKLLTLQGAKSSYSPLIESIDLVRHTSSGGALRPARPDELDRYEGMAREAEVKRKAEQLSRAAEGRNRAQKRKTSSPSAPASSAPNPNQAWTNLSAGKGGP